MIESPKGEKFLARRKAKEEDTESGYDTGSDDGDEDEMENDGSDDVGFYLSDGVDDEALDSQALDAKGADNGDGFELDEDDIAFLQGGQ